jgi:hypothetical protein
VRRAEGDLKMEYFKEKPKNLGVFLGAVEYGGQGICEIYNRDGEAVFVKQSPYSKEWMVSTKHVGGGFMLRKLGVEANAGAGIFRHYTLSKDAFDGKNREQIIALQESSGR